ncbi:hypothetical protein TIFTF001_031896 [Ficus carica]|uniref:Uncharacterized protein n=1 Tax=Ficus carica TaxID=3494 RepID=A0AA88DVW4_FICCA|nr:hypothetical protein TIFTF001_031896 [Ficus carica]
MSKWDEKFEAGLELSGDEWVDRGEATVGAEQREQVGRGGLGGFFRREWGGKRMQLEREWRVGVGGGERKREEDSESE